MKKYLTLLLLPFSAWATEIVDNPPKVPVKKDESVKIEAPAAHVEAIKSNLTLLGTTVKPNSFRTLSWSSEQSFTGIDLGTPVLVASGAQPGPTLCLTAAVHGDELNGIEITRQVVHPLDTNKLKGTVIGVPIVNLDGFHNSSRYLKDRRDLNRYFPGSTEGASASRIAYSFFSQIITHCDALVDLHTGSFYRTNLPQIRADLSHPPLAEFSRGFGDITIVQSKASTGTLRGAAMEHGIPAVTMELGAPMSLDLDSVSVGVAAIKRLMRSMDMLPEPYRGGSVQPIYVESFWLRSDHSGIFVSNVSLGVKIKKGDILGTVTDPVTNAAFRVRAQSNSTVIGKAINQFVYPGFAVFHLAINTTPEKVEKKAAEIQHQEETQERAIEGLDGEPEIEGGDVGSDDAEEMDG
ncbi:succinylglutamate desuccinylase/aspartoacylase family protein [Motilimonas sp. 1_MG-2023]|uniref:succinylglutamate desuccinylase/aspartoacylase family protein n=1 Tax=Motilimonas sp. 1_MG-2023 TaxID=3062672 RepID=UPI0026E26804|nr:succinylglutamate desuccinylase/aspartoacylase family protein [Motilimonas sp. 1_MG-2023]MDO6524870.1 succinylglutamate desuccinylase/aspartoacylase family protein [Motilimonas sp. 1_MG-2023]